MPLTMTLGAVAFEPLVVAAWDSMATWLANQGLELRRTLYASYAQLTDAHLRGHVDVAWNSALAHLDTEMRAFTTGRHARALLMRDTDRDLRSVVLVRADAPARTLADLAGLRVGVGAADSPQGTILPLNLLLSAGVRVTPVLGDTTTGTHGDAAAGERHAARELMAGRVDAACMADANLMLFAVDGEFQAQMPRVIAQSEPFDARVFTVIAEQESPATDRFAELLLGMTYDDPAQQTVLDLLGLREWRPARTQGFARLAQAHAALREAGWL